MEKKKFDAENAALRLYSYVINKYGIEAQKMMLIEECGELLNAVAKLNRGRSTKTDIITELADVHIMVEQMACYFGWEEFKAEKGRKLERLLSRIHYGSENH